MFQRDFILRMIEQFTKVMTKILFNEESKNYSLALEDIRVSYKTVFGIDKELIDASSAEEIIELLKLQGRNDPKIMEMIADFIMKETNLEMMVGGLSDLTSVKNKIKSLSLYLEAADANPDVENEELWKKIEVNTGELKNIHKPASLIKKIIYYYEIRNNYSEAENLLFELIESDENGLVDFGENFYTSLDSKSDIELSKGNFSREEIQQGRKEFKKRIKNKLK